MCEEEKKLVHQQKAKIKEKQTKIKLGKQKNRVQKFGIKKKKSAKGPNPLSVKKKIQKEGNDK